MRVRTLCDIDTGLHNADVEKLGRWMKIVVIKYTTVGGHKMVGSEGNGERNHGGRNVGFAKN